MMLGALIAVIVAVSGVLRLAAGVDPELGADYAADQQRGLLARKSRFERR